LLSSIALANLLVALVVLVVPFAFASAALADGGVAPLSANGLGPDAQLVGGGGFGLGGSLRNPFLGRARLGALYAVEPWIFNAGISFEVGALGQLGVGCELELNAWRGFFADLGFARADGKQWMGHLSLGYTVFGIEWQQRFSDARPNHALLFEVRLPLGIWWRLVGRNSEQRSAVQARQAQALSPARTVPPTAAASPLPLVRAPSADQPPVAAESIGPSEADRAELAQAQAEAERETQRGNHAAAAAALQRAYMLHPDARILLQLAQAELAQGRLLLAAKDLRRFLDTARTPQAQAERVTAQSQLDGLQRRLAHLRVELTGAMGDEQIELDGVVEAAATLGYDVALDPGEHSLVMLRHGQPLARRSFKAAEAELVRVSIDATTPEAPSAQ
jgi:hypothetical protein